MKASPTEVRHMIAADFKRMGITHEIAARTLGYKNKQTIANIVSRKQDNYLSYEQASRFHFTYNYQINYLTSGEGSLYEEKRDPMDGLIDINPPFKGLSKESLVQCIDLAESIINTCGNPTALKAWGCVLDGDYEGYLTRMNELGRANSIRPDIPYLAHYTFEKMKENNDEQYYSSFLYGPKNTEL